MPGLAARLGLHGLAYKDEGSRFGLGSFKALGGAYAVSHLLRQRLRERHGLTATTADLLAGQYRDRLGDATFATRLTAIMADRSRGALPGRLPLRDLPPRAGSREREAAIARYGAEIRLPGGYDGSVRRCAADATAQGWYSSPTPRSAAV